MSVTSRLVFFDLVTDRVRNRALQVLGTLFVVQTVFFLVGSNLLLDPRSASTDSVSSVDLFRRPVGASLGGAPFAVQPLVRLMHQTSPVARRSARVRVAGVQTSLLPQHMECAVESYQSVGDHSASRNALCSAAFRGLNTTVKSNLCGVSFFNLSISAGLVGLYELEFVADEGTATAFVRTTSSISGMRVSSTLPKRLRTQVPQGSVHVTVAGAGVGSTVFLLCDSIHSSDLSRSLYYETQKSPLPCLLSPSTAVVGSDGVARFDNVTVAGALDKHFEMLVVAEWMATPLLPRPASAGRLFVLDTDVAAVAFVAEGVESFAATEGFAVSAVVRVTDAAGNPLRGKRVYAQIVYELYEESFADNFWPKKELQNCISEETDATGAARWSSLRFDSTGPPGNYSVWFRCEGVVSSPVVYRVASRVSRLFVRSNTAKLPENRSYTMLELGLPLVVIVAITDQVGNPVKGKSVQMASRYGRIECVFVSFLPSNSDGVPQIVVAASKVVVGDEPVIYDEMIMTVDGVSAAWPVAAYKYVADPRLCLTFRTLTAPTVIRSSSFSFSYRACNAMGGPVSGVSAQMILMASLPLSYNVSISLSDADGVIRVNVTNAVGFKQTILFVLYPSAGGLKCAGITEPGVVTFLGPQPTLSVVSVMWQSNATARIAIGGAASDVQLVTFSSPVVPTMRSLVQHTVQRLPDDNDTSLFDVTFAAGARGNFSFFAVSMYVCSEMVVIERTDTVASLVIATPLSETQQPVLQVLDADGKAVQGVVVTVRDASLAAVAVAGADSITPFDDSGLLASAPSDASGRAVFAGLTLLNNSGRLCYSTRYVDEAAVDFEALSSSSMALGAYGQNGVMRESASVCQSVSTAQVLLACQLVKRTALIASLGYSFGGGVVSNCPLTFSPLTAVDANGQLAGIQPSEVYVNATASFALPNITFLSGKAGDYTLFLGSLALGTVTLVDEPSSLSILLDTGLLLNGLYSPNASTVVAGQDDVNVVIRATNSGVPITGCGFRVTIESGDGEIAECVNVTRDSILLTAYAQWTEGGVACFWISLTKARVQGDKFVFRIASLDRPSLFVLTKPVLGYSLVSNVTVAVAPAATDTFQNKVVISDDASSAVGSLVQPVVQLTDQYGDGLQGLVVEPVMASCKGPIINTKERALLQYDPVRSDAGGMYRFVNLQVIAAVPGRYCMRFEATGMASVWSEPMDVFDTNVPDVESYDNLELFLGLSLLGALPLMAFNSRHITARWAVVVSFILAVGVLVGLCAFLGVIGTTPGLVVGSNSDPLLLTQLVITLLVVISTLLILLWTALWACCGGTEYHDRTAQMYKDHVRLLLRPVTDAKLLKEANKKEERKRRQTASAAERKRWAEEPELAWHVRASRLLWVETVDVLVMARDDYILDTTYMDYGKHLRTNLTYSARFLTVFGVALLSVIVACLAAVVIILSVTELLAEAKVKLATMEVAVIADQSSGLLLGGAAIVLSQMDIINATGVGGLVAQSLDFAAPLLDGDTSGVGISDSRRYLSSAVMESVTERMVITGAVAAGIAALYALVIIFSLLFVYKRQMYAARNGTLFSVQFDRNNQRPTAASELPGIMFSHVLVGVLMSFAVFWLLIFAFSFAAVREFAMNSSLKLLLTLLTVNIVWGVLHFVFSVVIRKGFYIRDFFIFSLFDFVENFLSIASSAILGLVRIIVGAAATILLFVTPVVPLLGWTPLILIDFSYKAWRGLILNDSIHMNPVVQVAVACFKDPIDRDESPRRLQARRMWWRTVMKTRFPSVFEHVRVADVVRPGQHRLAVRVEKSGKGKSEEERPLISDGEDDDDEGRPLIEYARM